MVPVHELLIAAARSMPVLAAMERHSISMLHVSRLTFHISVGQVPIPGIPGLDVEGGLGGPPGGLWLQRFRDQWLQHAGHCLQDVEVGIALVN
jgi:hypothetical protein